MTAPDNTKLNTEAAMPVWKTRSHHEADGYHGADGHPLEVASAHTVTRDGERERERERCHSDGHVIYLRCRHAAPL